MEKKEEQKTLEHERKLVEAERTRQLARREMAGRITKDNIMIAGHKEV
jgi:hypothetical protein